jgi:hypothetical protein
MELTQQLWSQKRTALNAPREFLRASLSTSRMLVEALES